MKHVTRMSHNLAGIIELQRWLIGSWKGFVVRWPRTILKVRSYLPKSLGRLVRDMSLRPRTVRARSWLKPAGNRGIGLLLKSAICSARSFLMSSGISGMSVNKFALLRILILWLEYSCGLCLSLVNISKG